MAEPVSPACAHTHDGDTVVAVSKINSSHTLVLPNRSIPPPNAPCASSRGLAATESRSDVAYFSQSTSDLTSSVFSSLQDSQYSRDLLSDNYLPEIELVSLCRPDRDIPRYRLRVDPCTAFVGYQNKDFRGARKATRRLFAAATLTGQSTAELETRPTADSFQDASDSRPTESALETSSSDEGEASSDAQSLTTEQIAHTLDYFLLCGLRVSQMAHTYEDLDAITHLLEEKQNDLELAANIGKTLLDRNRDLERRLADTEKKLATTDDTISQLRHNLSIKDNLLHIYMRDHPEDMGDDHTTISSGWLSPVPEVGSGSLEGSSFPSINFSQLNRKVRELEEENMVLREEHNRLTATADQLDEHETALIRDCARQLVSANAHIRTLSDELSKKSDAYMNQQSEVTRLLTRGLDLESRVKQLTAENELLANRLRESQTTQLCLSNEVCLLRDKYDECLSLFNEARAEVRALRKRSRRAHLRSAVLSSPSTLIGGPPPALGSSSNPFATDPASPTDGSGSSGDLTANSQRFSQSECSLASDLARTAAKDQAAMNCERLFRALDQGRTARSRTVTGGGSGVEYGQDDTVSSSGFFSGSEPSEFPLSARDDDSAPHRKDSHSSKAGALDAGTVTPLHASDNLLWDSSNPLAHALKRHSWFGPDPQGSHHTNRSFGTSLDDSMLPSDPSELYAMSCSKLPQRLQLVKPVEGSHVLRHWQHLATPSFTRALFDDPPPLVQSRAVMSSPVLEPRCITTSSVSHPRGISRRPELPSAVDDYRAIGSKTTDQFENARNRFGFSLPGQLACSSIRSRSLENVQPASFRRPPSITQQPASALRSSSPFSLTSLVAALLPFPLSDGSQATKPFRTTVPQQVEGDCGGPEVVRIRPQSTMGSRGLLDVGDVFGQAASPSTLQRIPATEPKSNCCQLPAAAPPPPHLISTPSRSSFPRTVRNSSLSGITEESGSPPDTGSSVQRETDAAGAAAAGSKT